MFRRYNNVVPMGMASFVAVVGGGGRGGAFPTTTTVSGASRSLQVWSNSRYGSTSSVSGEDDRREKKPAAAAAGVSAVGATTDAVGGDTLKNLSADSPPAASTASYWDDVQLPVGLSEAAATATASAVATAGSAAQGAASSVTKTATSWSTTVTAKIDESRTKETLSSNGNTVTPATTATPAHAVSSNPSSWWPAPSSSAVPPATEPPKKEKHLSFLQRWRNRGTEKADKAAWSSLISGLPVIGAQVTMGVGLSTAPVLGGVAWALMRSSLGRSSAWYVVTFVGRQLLSRPYTMGSLFSGLAAFYWVAAPIAAVVSTLVCIAILSMFFLPLRVSSAIFGGIGKSFLLASNVAGAGATAGAGAVGGGFFAAVGKLFWFTVVVAASVSSVFCWHYYLENTKLRHQLVQLGVPVMVDLQKVAEEEEREKRRIERGRSSNPVVGAIWATVDWMEVWYLNVSSFLATSKTK